MLCFERKYINIDIGWNGTSQKCVEYDGRDSVDERASTIYTHRDSCLAFLNGKAMALGSSLTDGNRKVEEFDNGNWTELPTNSQLPK